MMAKRQKVDKMLKLVAIRLKCCKISVSSYSLRQTLFRMSLVIQTVMRLGISYVIGHAKGRLY